MVESSIVIYQDTIVDYSAGTATSVEFRFEYIWNYKKKIEQQKIFEPADLHFIHVHSPGIHTYSQLDENCVQGLSIAFGYPVLFSIVLFPSKDIHNLEYTIQSYQYVQNSMKKVPSPGLYTEYLIILKLLAFRGN